MSEVFVVMGSDSDWKVMKAAFDLLQEFGIQVEKRVVSAHRTPELLASFTKECENHHTKCIIAGAGGAAHLPGMLASFTHLPIIGVPVKGSSLDGVDSLYSIVQMPRGVPVATVGINNATNAALLALRILATQNQDLTLKLKEYRETQFKASLEKTKNLI
ncbi:MAG: 5-(carboxyamino)imidazole ribonucleotide mutase [Halobacteriovoraceae bacterium]|nr:5-(carboxyamino)imidazole ribonucleotide mutase [Halobacteriovoraceae bacterium]|tara:strand:- start:7655 stop:8134 length:480 start_codon:yes stop_codon:yes gene_type:complete